ncbi:MAG: sensor histidine kinase, partial [Acidimicrobiia bacterium]
REFSLHPRPADAAQVVAGAVEALQPAAAEAGLRLVCSAPEPVPATLDPERLAQMVANLVENALKYAATTVEVAVEPDPPGVRGAPEEGAGAVLVSVVDDGPGVDPADLPHVFERLYTSGRHASVGDTPNPRARKVGTGLGLAIVAQLAGAMGGTATTGRTPEGRTRFTVSVAARPSGWSSSSGAGSSSSSSPSASSSSSRRTAP